MQMNNETAKSKKCPFFTPQPSGNCIAEKCMAWEVVPTTPSQCCGMIMVGEGKCMSCGATRDAKGNKFPKDGTALLCDNKVKVEPFYGGCFFLKEGELC